METKTETSISELERELCSEYFEGIKKAIDEIDKGERDSAFLATLNGAVHIFEKGHVQLNDPDAKILVRNSPIADEIKIPINYFFNIVESNLSEAAYIYYQLYPEQKKKNQVN
ncbi:hypothetical protein B6U80_00205 [Candidatus Pacearchaeota archaeon ex4484_26]|nr:MAG: hypothetical protein B6U80_00205 [Candidatus Pacearchaeota archaeon ex4484_26]